MARGMILNHGKAMDLQTHQRLDNRLRNFNRTRGLVLALYLPYVRSFKAL